MDIASNTGHPRRWAILGVLVVSLLVVVLDNTVLNVALRTIADPVHGLGATQSQLEWAINSYTLVFAGLLFTAGVLGDRYGRRATLLIGLVLFGLASFASAYAQSPAQLIGARALMGIGGAAVMPVTLSIISNVFDPRERARAIGVWAGSVGLAVAIGPVVGGALLERYWWGSVFLINVPIVVAGVIAVLAIVPESRDPKPGRVDVAGVLLSVLGLVVLVYGVVDAGDHGFGRPVAWGSIVAGLAILAGFVAYERRIPFPSLDVRLFADRRFSAAVAAVGLVFFAAMGSMFFMAFYLQLVRGYSPLKSGLLMVPFAVAQMVFAPRSSALVRRYGPKAVMAAGMVVTGVALAGFAFVTVGTAAWVVAALAFVQGVGMANVMPPATESVMSSLPREKAGVGSAVSNTVRQVASALGVAVLGSVLSAAYRGGMAPHVTGLPAAARTPASESISGGYAVAARLGTAGRTLIGHVNDAFVHAMHYAAIGSTLVALIGLLVVFGWVPRHSARYGPVVAEETSRDRELADIA
ncbi:MFS transporter [Planosporangium thailandense]|uniref:MFS transporter n=1 Tax=Planosporangium thailandense TaxID=765197 RepID=A0ABX0Y2W7_9ACTN|nr:MFS transporter [Planosporangium thailandense]NJC72719.1 MFS transporter [Planosporangium thailandense]